MNLQGVERAAIERGDVLAPAGTLVPTLLLDGTLELLEDAPRPIKTRDRIRFHAGTQEVMARVLPVGRAELEPGQSCPARFRLESPLVALPGDRFVARSYSPIVTIGGGTILDIAPPRFKRKGPALAEHLALLATGEPGPGAGGASPAGGRRGSAGRRPAGPDALRPPAAARAPGRAPAGGPHRGGGSRVVSAPGRERPPALPDPGAARGLSRENPLRGGISREELRSRVGARAGARLRPAPGRARGRGGGPERAGPGPPGLARDPPVPGAGAGGQGARGRLPERGRGAPEPGGGARPGTGSRATRSTISSRCWSRTGRCSA